METDSQQRRALGAGRNTLTSRWSKRRIEVSAIVEAMSCKLNGCRQCASSDSAKERRRETRPLLAIVVRHTRP